MKDSIFYNQESTRYSEKRYPRVAKTYTQFFFKRRLVLTKAFLNQVLSKAKNPLELVEVGCADGVVVREIEQEFPGKFKKLIGIDIAAEMIEEARKKNTSARTQFFTRDTYIGTSADIVVETGVINYANFDDEMAFAAQQLISGGYYIFSIAGTGSLLNRLKPEGDFNDFRSYAEYDRIVRKDFDVVSVRGCGFFVPFLWRVPALARPVQAIIDPIVGFFAPGLCHEKVYLVRKK
jgi:predicted TPR repeat methyltransferase